MKKTLSFLVIFIFTLNISFAQKSNELFSIRIGYGSTNIVFKEAFEPTAQFFGTNINTGKTFVGDGPEFGISKSINSKLFIDFSLSTFSGHETKLKVNNNENYYFLKGFQIPMTANYQLRKPSKKFRINLGAGFQYLNARLRQFENITTTSGQITNQLTDIKISEVELTLRPGIQFRIISNLLVSFIVNVSLSTNGRYSDNPCFSLRYTFNKKK